MKLRFFLSTILLAVSSLSFADYRAGISSLNISPNTWEAERSCMGGYGSPYSRCGLTKVHDPIKVTSLYLSDDDTETVFVSLDVPGIGDSFIADAKKWIGIFTEIPEQQIFISATHTHSGPDLQGIWGGVDPAYKRRILIDTIITAFWANVGSKKADLYISQSKADVLNRRGLSDVDSDVTTIQLKRPHSNKIIASFVNMSAHPTILDDTNQQYSSDYVHYLREKLNNEFGAPVLFVNGMLGDSIPFDPESPIPTRTFETAQIYGERVAQGIIDNIQNSELILGDIDVSSTSFTHPVSNPGMLQLAQIGLLDVNLNEANEVELPISSITIGDLLSIVTLPGEALTSIGRAIQNEMPSGYQIVHGLTDASYGYFIPSQQFGSIPGHLTEETASIDIFVGDALQSSATNFLNAQ